MPYTLDKISSGGFGKRNFLDYRNDQPDEAVSYN